MDEARVKTNIEQRLADLGRQQADCEAAFNAGLALGRLLGRSDELKAMLAALGEPVGVPDDPPKEEGGAS